MQIALFVFGVAAAIVLILICIGVYDKREPREDLENDDSRLSMYRPSRANDFVIGSPIRTIGNQNRPTYLEPSTRVSYRDEIRNENHPHIALYVRPSAPVISYSAHRPSAPVMNDSVSDRPIRNSPIDAANSRQTQPIAEDLPPTYEECVGYVIH